MKKIILPLIALIVPFVILQLWNCDDKKIAVLIWPTIFITALLLVLLVVGLRKRRKHLVYGLPLFIVGLVLSVICINVQSSLNKSNAELIVNKIEAFKLANKKYPKRLSVIQTEVDGQISEEWFLFRSNEFKYVTDSSNQTYLLYLKLGAKETSVWASGMGTWQFLD